MRYLMLVEDALREAGVDPAIARPPRAMPPYTMFPVREFLPLVHAAGEAMGPTPEEGIARLFEGSFPKLIELPGARMFISPLDREPFSLLSRFATSRSLAASYGEWEIEGAAGDATLVIRREWAWIGAMWQPILASVFTACRLPAAHIDTTYEDPYSARLRFRW